MCAIIFCVWSLFYGRGLLLFHGLRKCSYNLSGHNHVLCAFTQSRDHDLNAHGHDLSTYSYGLSRCVFVCSHGLGVFSHSWSECL